MKRYRGWCRVTCTVLAFMMAVFTFLPGVSVQAADTPVNLLNSENTEVTASEGTATGTYRAWNKLVDGNKSANEYGWGIVQKDTADVEGWIQLDLNTAEKMNAIALFPQTLSGRVGYGFPDDFNVSVSSDGGKTYKGVTGGGDLGVTGYNKSISADPAVFYFAETEVTNIRVDFTRGTLWNPGDGKYGVVFSEIEAYLVTEDQKTSAEDVAEDISLIYAPLRDTSELTLPSVPGGFRAEIASSSDENIIALGGTVNHPAEDTVVSVRLKITNISDPSDTATTKLLDVPVCREYAQPSVEKTLEEVKEEFETQKVGFFVHYVPMLTAGKDGVVNDIDELADNLDVQQFADDMEKFGVQYVAFTAWHAGQKVLYPSDVNKRWRDDRRAADSTAAKTYSDRDVIRELIDALKKKDIDLYLYVHPSDGHDFKDTYNLEGDQELTGWNDAADNYEIWARYQEELFDELARRYGSDIKGYVVDGNYSKAGEARLINAVRAYNPTAVFTSNVGGNRTGNASPSAYGLSENTDYVFWEVSRMTSPDNGLGFATTNPEMSTADARTWPASRTAVALTMDIAWWAKNQNLKSQYTPDQMFRYAAVQAATSTSGGVLFSTGCTPYSADNYSNKNIWDGVPGAGTIYQTLVDFNQKYLSKVAESVKNTHISTAYPNEQVTWAAKDSGHPQWGVATESADRSYIYLHVMNKPAGNMLTIGYPEDGSEIKDTAQILKFDGTKVSVPVEDTGTGYAITLPAGESWSDVDTIIKIERKTDDVGEVPDLTIRTSSMHNVWKYPERMINGIIGTENTWLSDAPVGAETGQLKNENQEQWVELDFGRQVVADKLTLYPTNGEDAKDSNKGLPRDFTIQIFDGEEWYTAASYTDVENSSDPFEIIFNKPVEAEKIKIHATRLNLFDTQWSHYRMGFNEIQVNIPEQVSPVTATPDSGTYETGQQVELNCETDGAVIYYTTDGTDPAESDTRQEYSEAIEVESSVTLKTIAVKSGMLDSELASFEYVINSTVPTEPGEIYFDIRKGENTPDIHVGNFSEELAVLLLTDDEKVRWEAGENIYFSLELENIDQTVSQSDKEIIDTILGNQLNDGCVGMYFDLSLYKKAGDDKADRISELPDGHELEITVDIPDDMKTQEKGLDRTYHMLCIHENQGISLPVDCDPENNRIVFKTDMFSTYAMAYTDNVQKNENDSDHSESGSDSDNTVNNKEDYVPVTGDSAQLIIWCVLFMAASGTVLVFRKGLRK